MGTGLLKNRVAVITGAHGGLGHFVTLAFLAEEARVAGLSRAPRPTAVANPGFLAFPADLASGETARVATAAVIDRFGQIDVLAHLVGGFEGGKEVIATDDATFDRMLDLNLRSAFNIIRAVVPHMRERKYGRIIAVGSRTAIEPQALLGAYGASKAALVSLVHTVALENKDYGITANVVLPSTMDTPANRTAMPDADPSSWVQPAQVARLILWLASDDSSQISGARIPIYGREV